MNDFERLSKKERKELKRSEEKNSQANTSKSKSFRNKAIIVIIIILAFYGLYKIFTSPPAVKPGSELPDLGREHVPAGTEVKYNSNPPTSGSHDADWEKAGIYKNPLEDHKLVHSLEHGYVIISYNCDYKRKSWSGAVYAHEDDANDSTSSAESKPQNTHLDLKDWQNDTECKNLLSEITKVAKNQGLKKLIVVPRPTLDNRIALTAWTKLDKFVDFDEKRINTFIQAYWDRGPEKTME